MEGLIKRIEGAADGSRELDSDILIAFYAGRREVKMKPGSDTAHIINRGDICEHRTTIRVPNYSTSLDDALSLVPEGCSWFAEMNNGNGHAGIHWPKCDPASKFGHAATAPLALCIAALKARRS